MADTEVAVAEAPAAPADGLLEAAPAIDWHQSLPDDLRLHPSLADVKDVAGLAKRFVDTKALVGDSIRIPKPDAPPEEWQRFNAKMGVAESPEKIQIPKPPAGANLPWDENGEKKLRGAFHKAALRPDQVKILTEAYQLQLMEERDAAKSEDARIRRETEEALTKHFGPKGSPIYNQALAKARWATKELGGDDPEISAMAEAYGEEPGFVRLMAKLADMIGEEKGFPSEPFGGLTAADALVEYTEMMSNKKGAYYNPMHPDHEAATERILFLRKILDHEKRKG